MKIEYIIFILIILSYIFFSYKKKFIINELKYIKLNYYLIFVVLGAIILNIISINSSTIKTYNQEYSNNEHNKSHFYYDFLNPYDIFKFPFEQLELWWGRNPYDTLEIVPKFEDNDTENILVIIDKTGSTVSDNNINELKKRIIKEIENPKSLKIASESCPIKVPKNADMRDLLAYKIVQNFYDSNAPNISYNILYYYGADSLSKIFRNRKSIKDFKYCEAITSVNSYIKKVKINTTNKTDISSVFSCIEEDISLWGEDNNIDDFFNIVFISDFEHEPESGVSFQEFEYILEKSLTEINCEKLCLVKLDNKQPRNFLSKQTIELIQKNTQINTLLYCFDEFNIIDEGQQNTETYNSFIYTIGSISKNNISNPILLYYPSDFIGSTKVAKGKLNIKTLSYDKMILTLEDNNRPILEKGLKLKLNNCFYLNANHSICLDYKSINNKPIELSSNVNEVSNKALFLNISIPDDFLALRCPIIVREKLSLNSLYILCFLFLTILFLYSINTISYSYAAFAELFLKKCKNKFLSTDKKLHKVLIGLFGLIQTTISISIIGLLISSSRKLHFLPKGTLIVSLIIYMSYIIAFIIPGYYYKYHPTD